MTAPDLSVDLAGVRLPSPLVLASGIWGTSAALLARAAADGAGAVTSKTVGPVPRSGHEAPICLDWGAGVINAVGLPGPGADAEASVISEAKQKTGNAAVIASIFGDHPDTFAEAARTVAAGGPDMLEVNMSCPNVRDDFGTPFAAAAETAAAVTEAVRAAVSVPVFVKLAPNVPSIARIAAAVVEAGADGITAINTVPGMVIDVDAGCPVLTNGSGGLSGPAIRPAAVKAVYDIRRALPDVPLIGTGGVTNGRDAAEMLMAGATAVGVGTAVYHRGAETFTLLARELSDILTCRGAASVADIRGLAQGGGS